MGFSGAASLSVSTGVVILLAVMSMTSQLASSPVRNCSSCPSSSMNTMGGTLDVSVTFGSVTPSLGCVVLEFVATVGSCHHGFHCVPHQLNGLCLSHFYQYRIRLVAPELRIRLLSPLGSRTSCLSSRFCHPFSEFVKYSLSSCRLLC